MANINYHIYYLTCNEDKFAEEAVTSNIEVYNIEVTNYDLR